MMAGRVYLESLSPVERESVASLGTWQLFSSRVRSAGTPLLRTLADYPDCVLVGGCQRSGTTMVTRIIAHSETFTRLELSEDDELDAALVLAGHVALPTDNRYGFQTTYLNERYREYGRLGARQRLIWVLRNPYSVVWSMLYNWKRFALDELYAAVGEMQRAGSLSLWRRLLPPSALERACWAYRGKLEQLGEIAALVPKGHLHLVEYDELVNAPHDVLGRLFSFIGAPYDRACAEAVSRQSLTRGDGLPRSARRIIERIATPGYERGLAMLRRQAAG